VNLLACEAWSGQVDGMNKILIPTLLFAFVGVCVGQITSAAPSPAVKGSSAPYTEGPIWTLTFIKTKAGLSDEYFRQISQTVKPVYEAAKTQKIVLDYKILTGDAFGMNDADVIIMVEYPNMAALDGLRDKMDPILEKTMGSEDQRRNMAVKRLDIREILGTKTMREITLK
jgi:hypothetical protein